MLTHTEIFESLKQAFPQRKGVSLVASFFDEELQLPGRRAHIFIGDCHLLNEQDAEAYPKNRFSQGEDLLTLLEALTELKADSPGQLTIWQLGDLFDIWRARGGLGPAAEVDKIAADHYQIIDLIRYGAPYGVGAQVIAGNHDYGLHQLGEWNAARYRIIQNDDPAGGDMLVLHGDIFDWIEKLPDELQARVVRFATWHSAGKKDLFNEAEAIAEVNRGLKDGDRPIGKAKAPLAGRAYQEAPEAETTVNVINGDAGDPRAAKKRFFTSAKSLAEELRKRGHNIRLMVIGHTHWARILRGRLSTAEPFALLDCGAWTGFCRLGPSEPWLHSAQLSVVVDNEARLYQVGRRTM